MFYLEAWMKPTNDLHENNGLGLKNTIFFAVSREPLWKSKRRKKIRIYLIAINVIRKTSESFAVTDVSAVIHNAWKSIFRALGALRSICKKLLKLEL